MNRKIVSIVALFLAATIFYPLTNCNANKKKSKAEEKADLFYQIGEDYFKKGDYLAALKELLKSAEIDKKNPDTEYLLGTTYYHLQHYPEAEEHLKTAIMLKEDSSEGFPQAHNNLGMVYLATGRYDEAIASFETCLGYIFYQPSFPQTYTNIGIAYDKKGDTEKAIENFKHAIKLAPDFCPAHLNLANQYSKMGKHNQAAIEYRKVVDICGASLLAQRARLYLGVELNESGNKQEACEQFFAVLTDTKDTEIAAKAGEYLRLLHCK